MAAETAQLTYEEKRREYIKRVVAEAPPLTPEQIADLREIFRPAREALAAARDLAGAR